MATLAVGDVQGCFRTLSALLRSAGFRAGRDRLWLVGDLVNRGPASLDVLRCVADLGDNATVVLGNHDLYLLGVALGAHPRRKDTLDDVLEAPDFDDLAAWLRARPLLHREDGRVLVHAGLHPRWSAGDAERAAREVEALLRGGDAAALLAGVREAPPWAEELRARERTQAALAALTRLRACRPDGTPCADFAGPLDEMPDGCLPWFDVPGRASASSTILFGHWAALGLLVRRDVVALDSGCVWGGTLTALRLEDGRLFEERLADRVGRS
jgi:bis(5'-nucleosyl)-tetraphosphatase (symmetrical)